MSKKATRLTVKSKGKDEPVEKLIKRFKNISIKLS